MSKYYFSLSEMNAVAAMCCQKDPNLYHDMKDVIMDKVVGKFCEMLTEKEMSKFILHKNNEVIFTLWDWYKTRTIK